MNISIMDNPEFEKVVDFCSLLSHNSRIKVAVDCGGNVFIIRVCCSLMFKLYCYLVNFVEVDHWAKDVP